MRGRWSFDQDPAGRGRRRVRLTGHYCQLDGTLRSAPDENRVPWSATGAPALLNGPEGCARSFSQADESRRQNSQIGTGSRVRTMAEFAAQIGYVRASTMDRCHTKKSCWPPPVSSTWPPLGRSGWPSSPATSPGLSPPYWPMGVVIRTQIAAIDAELARLPDSGPAQAGEAGAVEISRPP